MRTQKSLWHLNSEQVVRVGMRLMRDQGGLCINADDIGMEIVWCGWVVSHVNRRWIEITEGLVINSNSLRM